MSHPTLGSQAQLLQCWNIFHTASRRAQPLDRNSGKLNGKRPCAGLLTQDSRNRRLEQLRADISKDIKFYSQMSLRRVYNVVFSSLFFFFYNCPTKRRSIPKPKIRQAEKETDLHHRMLKSSISIYGIQHDWGVGEVSALRENYVETISRFPVLRFPPRQQLLPCHRKD